MYDLRSLKDNLHTIKAQLGLRGNDVDWDDLEKLLQSRRDLIAQVEALRHQLKKGSEEVAQLKRNKKPADEAMASMRAIGDNIKIQEEQLRDIEAQLENLALRIPNVPHASVPDGIDANDNVETRAWGTPRTFDFTPKPH